VLQVGFLYRECAMGGVHPEAKRFVLACVPIVVVGAPLGSLLGSHMHRLVLAWFIYVLDFVQVPTNSLVLLLLKFILHTL
jgi:hypothetical protein